MASAAAGAGAAASKAARKAAFKRYPVSPALKRFLGVGEISRPDSLKQVWAYVKSHALQNPLRRREIVCDEKLKSIFGGKDKVDFLEVPGLLSSHFSKST
ncbi:hypothetical protein O6H91_17G060600 [Diphasiastrum complanatum]|uniref:Uncharacterized protein n=1 Tax=Diphasiastrum complanatum TaxID=34168 RepID=A0ACC2B7B3_DIPCM|nr:hypothetical protein O6H91_17G060600 [Diphasiastrum complanatum]